MQALASMESLIEYINKEKTSESVVMNEFHGLAVKLKATSDSQTYRAGGLVGALASHGNKRLFTYQQQDAQEFFQQVSSMITKESSRNGTNSGLGLIGLKLKNTIPILFGGKRILSERMQYPRSPLTGLLASRISCMRCRYQVRVC
jgi:ubiquitin carboxyl-terminal hydrolase 1